MSFVYGLIPSASWKPPVANAAALPASGNTSGDARITLDTDFIYVWSGSAWVLIGGGGIPLAIGNTVVGGTHYANLYIDGSGNLADSFTVFDSAGSAAIEYDARILENAAFGNYLDWSGSTYGIDVFSHNDTPARIQSDYNGGDVVVDISGTAVPGGSGTFILTENPGGGGYFGSRDGSIEMQASTNNINFVAAGGPSNGFIRFSPDNGDIADRYSVITANIFNRQLYDSSGVPVADWNAQSLFDNAGAESLSWSSRILYDSVTTIAANWSSRILVDSVGNTSADWTQRKLFNSANTLTVNWDSSLLTEDTITSIDWLNRILKDTSGATVLDYSSVSAKIQGTNTNDNAAAGKYGQYVSSSVASGSAVTLTTASPKTVTSISLTAGDWDVSGVVCLNGTLTGTNFVAAIGTTTNALTGTVAGDTRVDSPFMATAASDYCQTIPTVRMSLSGTTTVYLLVQNTFTVGTAKAYGRISARRPR